MEYTENLLNNTDENKKRNILLKIKETEKEYDILKEEKSNDFINYLHCNGCMNGCSLSSTMCGRGNGIKLKIQEYENIKE